MWEKFYTPPNIADMIMESIDYANPPAAIDICVGSWNLLLAARKKWQRISLHGVDVRSEANGFRPDNSEFYLGDGRKFALENLRKNKYPLVLGNPPFGDISSDDYSKYNELPGFNYLPVKACRRIEATMTLANLALLDENGYMAIVVPNTLVTGDWAKELRAYIGENYQLESITHLPPIIFDGVRTAILLIKNVKPYRKDIPIYDYYNESQSYKEKHRIKSTHVASGVWLPHRFNYIDEEIFICRGKVPNSHLVTDGQYPVIHSTDINPIIQGTWDPKNYINDGNLNASHALGKPGDIIIIRVGRNSGTAVKLNLNTEYLLSDCLFVIRHSDSQKMDYLRKIVTSSKFSRDVESIKCGIGSRYITKELLHLYLSSVLKERVS